MQTKVKDLMKTDLAVISPAATLKEAAQKMEEVDCGVLPVGEQDRLEGVITDRDIVIRAVAKGKDLNTEKVRDHMTAEVCYCNEQDSLEQAADQMREKEVSRLLVKDSKGKSCGIITFGCILRKDEDINEVSKVVGCATGKKAA